MSKKPEVKLVPNDSFTVYVSEHNKQVKDLFLNRGYKVENVYNESEPPDMVVFTGGADICPFLYGERPIKVQGTETTFDANRDMREISLFKRLPYNTAKIGICRGAQLLNVLSGGSMWQHVDNHTSNHTIEIEFGSNNTKLVNVSSTHHQMMKAGTEGAVIGWATSHSKNKWDGRQHFQSKDDTIDPEIVYYWSTHSLCFQPHPEYGPEDCTMAFFKLVEDYFQMRTIKSVK